MPWTQETKHCFCHAAQHGTNISLIWKNRKKLAIKDTVSRKRKAVDDEVQNLNRKKQALQIDVHCHTASADQLAEKTEFS